MTWKCRRCGFTSPLAYFFAQDIDTGLIICKDCLIEAEIEKEAERIVQEKKARTGKAVSIYEP